jgi:TolB-like protein/Tfp pilus assembly protein PilF
VQVAALAASAFAWPNWVLQLVILSAVVGLPAALLFAWIVAVRREHGSVFRPTRADTFVLGNLGAILVVVAALLAVVFWPRMHRDTVDAASGPPPASVAVLPFANVGGDPGKRYFSDGLSDELITALARVPSLRVAARSSSFAFEGKAQDARAIARALNVRALLEGSVREAGNRVRITAQLVGGKDGYQLWSQSYDRQLTDILVLQDEIARSVTGALSARLLPKALVLPINADAYRLYLQGKTLSAKANPDDLESSISIFQKASSAAPRFAPVYAETAAAQLELADVYGKSSWLAPAEISATKAHELDPHNIQALVVLSEIAIDKWDWQKAIDLYRQARAINPENIFVVHLRSVLASIFQFPQEMLSAEMKAVSLNRLSLGLRLNIGNWYLTAGDYSKASDAIRQAANIQPGNLDLRVQQCLLAARTGKLGQARQLAKSLSSVYAKDPQNFGDCAFETALAERKNADARKIVDRAAADFLAKGGYATFVGDHYRKLGDYAAALAWYERAYVNREVVLFNVPYERKPDEKFLGTSGWKSLWAREPIRTWLFARQRFETMIVKPES